MAEDLILVHIPGATQTRQEWLDEIAAETMRYYRMEREKLTIEVADSRNYSVLIPRKNSSKVTP